MKKLVLIVVCSLLSVAVNAQLTDANYVIDYSQAIICGMDEETFAEVETDWREDNPEISGNMIQEMVDKLQDALPFKKNSKNTVKVTVRSITDNGKFVCDAELIDAEQKSLFKVEGVKCSKGGTWGSKLHLMKEGAYNEGKKLGSALKKAYTKYFAEHQ